MAIGGGPTGVELAGAIAELSRFVLAKDFRSIDPREAKVLIIEAGPRILPCFSASLGQSAVEQLKELGVEIRTGARVVSIDEGGVDLEHVADGVDRRDTAERERIASATVVWAAGVKANPLAQAPGE